MGFVSPQELWQKQFLAKEFDVVYQNDIFKDMVHGYGKLSVLDEYEDYRKGANDDWSKYWRYFCLFKWLQHENVVDL